jgi:preprotein translocase subunit SecA
MFQSIVRKIVGSKNDRDLKRLWPLVEEINKLEAGLEPLTNDALRSKTVEFRERLAKGEELDDILPEAFAIVREASRRVLGMRHFQSCAGRGLEDDQNGRRANHFCRWRRGYDCSDRHRRILRNACAEHAQ